MGTRKRKGPTVEMSMGRDFREMNKTRLCRELHWGFILKLKE